MYLHRYYLYEHYYTGIKRRLPEVIRLTDLLNSESMERNCILRIHLTTKVTRILRQRLKMHITNYSSMYFMINTAHLNIKLLFGYAA